MRRLRVAVSALAAALPILSASPAVAAGSGAEVSRFNGCNPGEITVCYSAHTVTNDVITKSGVGKVVGNSTIHQVFSQDGVVIYTRDAHEHFENRFRGDDLLNYQGQFRAVYHYGFATCVEQQIFVAANGEVRVSSYKLECSPTRR